MNDLPSEFEKHDFEEYYPARFSEKVAHALSEPAKKLKAQLKAQLLQEVIAFAAANNDSAKLEFQESGRCPVRC